MSSQAERRRNNVRAGIFVTMTIALAVVVVALLSDFKEYVSAPRRHYTVTYAVSEGVRNLKGGADVRVGGLNMGRVSDVRLRASDDPAAADSFGETIEVQFTLDRRIRLYDNATIIVASPLIGSDSWLEVVSLGGPAVAAQQAGEGEAVEPTLLADGGELAGYGGAGALDSVLGPRGGEIINSVANILGSFEEDYNDSIAPSLEDMRSLIADLQDNRWPAWTQSIDRVMTWAVDATDDLGAAIEEGRGTISDVRSTIADNRPKIDNIVENTESVSMDAKEVAAAIREQTQPILDKVQTVIDTAQSGLDETVGALQRIRQDYEGWETRLDDALGNATLTSQQLKLAAIEIRRSPWKLLYRPEPDELEHELLYDAVRGFALAVSDLKASSKSAQRILDRHAAALEDDPQVVERLRTNLIDSLDRYEKAQSRLFDVLLEDTPGR